MHMHYHAFHDIKLLYKLYTFSYYIVFNTTYKD